MSEHTKLPWHVEGMTLCVVSDHAPKGRMRVADIRGWGYLTGKGDGALGLSDDDAFAIQEANAAFIVQAVNSHDALVDALQNLVGVVGVYAGAGPVGVAVKYAERVLNDLMEHT